MSRHILRLASVSFFEKKKKWHLSVNIPRGNHCEPNHNPNTEDGCQSLNEKGHWTVELVQLSGCQDLSIFFILPLLAKKCHIYAKGMLSLE